MRTVLALLGVMFVMFASGVASAQQRQWRSFTSSEGRFTADFPGTPTVLPPQPTQTAIGVIQMHSVDLDIPHVAYHAVTYTDFPGRAITDADSVLQNAKNGAVVNVKGTLVDEKKIMVQGNKGLDLKLYANQLTIFQRLVLVQSRLYQVIMIVPGTRTTTPPEVLRFQQSFVITR